MYYYIFEYKLNVKARTEKADAHFRDMRNELAQAASTSTQKPATKTKVALVYVQKKILNV